jgi:hypothetical protein
MKVPEKQSSDPMLLFRLTTNEKEVLSDDTLPGDRCLASTITKPEINMLSYHLAEPLYKSVRSKVEVR